MRILELSLRNYRVFEEVDLELPARVIGIFGANGSGKTTLVDSIRYGLYGESRTDKKQIRTHGLLTDAAVRLVFEHGGQQYEVRRRIKGKNHSAEAELYVGNGQLAVGVTEVNQEVAKLLHMDQKVFRASVFAEQKQLDAFSEVRAGERKEMVLRLLGIRPVDVARAAARKRSRDLAGDVERLQGSIPDMAAKEQQLERDRAAAEEARLRAEGAANALGEAEQRATSASEAFDASDQVRQRVETLGVERRGTEQRADAHAKKHVQLTERIEKLEVELAALPELQEELERLDGAAKRHAAAIRAAEAESSTREVETKLAQLAELDTATVLSRLEAAQAERDKAAEESAKAESAEERAAEDVQAARAALDRATDADPSLPCPICGRKLGDDFDEYLAHSRTALANADKALAAATKKSATAATALKKAETALARATKEGEAARDAREQRDRLEERAREERDLLATLLEPFDGTLPDAAQLATEAQREEVVRTQVTALGAEHRRLEEARTDLEAEVADMEACGVRIEELDREVAGLAFDPEDHGRLRKERDEAVHLAEQARANDREIRDARAQLEREVARLEGEIEQAKKIADQVEALRDDARYLGKTSVLLDGFRDHLVGRIGPLLSKEAEALFRELTAGEYDALQIDEQTLAIQIADGAEWFPIERFSGSETDLANLALRVAISKHLSYMSGTDIGMLVLDEVLGSLDAERKDLFVAAMGRLSNHFHQLFVITHAEQVKDQFQAVVQVQETGRRRSTAVLV